MADQQDFERLLPVMKALAEGDVRYPDMPVDEAVKEAEIMAAASQEDREAFVGIGFDITKLAQLVAAIGALRFAQARLIAAMGEMRDAAKEWAEAEPEGYELRSEILAAEAYALRDIVDAKRAIKRIRMGSGHADMIQDLLALSELGKKYQQALEAIKFDVSLLDSAAEKANELGTLYAKAFIEKRTREPKVIRDRAFTLMRNLMSDILDAAEYSFRKDRSRLNYYYSAYRSRKRNNAAEERETATPAEEITA